MREQFFERDFGIGSERAGEREIDVRILIAPERGTYRRDEQRNLPIGEAEKRGGAALENVGVGTLRLPGQGVKGREGGDTAHGAGKDGGEKTQRFGERFGAAVGLGDEERGTAQLVRDVGGHKSLGDIVQTGNGDELPAGAQGGEGRFHRRMAQHTF